MRVGDLIEVPEIKTVIQLSDIEESNLRQMILDSFVVTSEVMKNLEMILPGLSRGEGKGAFLKGHFGSGKSHFLSMLSLLLRIPEAWQGVISQEPRLEAFRASLDRRRFFVVEVSLVQHRATEFLEDIFLRAIFRKLSLELGRPFEGADSRHETFRQIQKTLRGLGYDGLVLLVDELSEFLRSKIDAHAYREDIRFLQYLGEESASFPLWLIASLQEWIEETGEIHQETFNKIKDRYPLRISLGRAHMEELISQRLIRHRPEAEKQIRSLYHSLKRYFPSFPVDEARFCRLYPVHPATVTLLDRLRPLFSEHRGVVDFIHYRLKGDPDRGISSFLERPAEDLLGPSALFDHFLHRIRETAETQPFVEKGFDYYRDEIPRLFHDADQQRVALEAVKLLILFAISPVKVRYTVRHLAEMILFRVTDLEAEVNYQFVKDILDRLVKETAHLSVVPGKDPLDDQFSITLRADVTAILRRRIEQGARDIFSDDRRLFERLLPFAESPHLPFLGWSQQREQRVSILWEYTRRSGIILLRQIDEFLPEEADALADQWRRVEEDYFIIIGTTHQVEKQYEHLHTLLPRLRERCPGLFLFWVPAKIDDEEEGWMKRYLSALLLSEGGREGLPESGPQGREFLQTFLQTGKKRLGEILTRAYFNGLLFWDDRQISLSPYGYLSQEKFLEEFVPPLLSRRFPKHQRIHPYIEALSPTTIPTLLRDFFATGVLEVDDRAKFGLRAVVEGLLKPMGLVKKKGNQYLLHVDPKQNELTGHFLAHLEKGPVAPETLYWSFRKGDYGLLRHQFEVLLFSLLFTGNLLAMQGQRKKGLEDILRTGLQGITALTKGEILGEEFQNVLRHHPFVPEKFQKVPFTPTTQEALWDELRSAKEKGVESLRNLLGKIKWASAFQAFKNVPWESFRRDAEDVLSQWEELRVSFPAREGLERFLSASAREPFLAEKLRRLEELEGFLRDAERLLFVYQYVSDSRLVIPDQPPYESLRSQRDELLRFFSAKPFKIDGESVERCLEDFQNFRERYSSAYIEAHRQARSGEQFEPYDKIRRSRRYLLLARLDQLEMISVHHNRSLVDRRLSEVLFSECRAPTIEILQGSPVCSCGYTLGTVLQFPPLREIEEALDLGIRETMEALKSPTYQEKLLPYLRGLEEIGENEKAQALRKLLLLTPEEGEDFLSRLDEALTPATIKGINEAFRGKIVLIRRDLDQLYNALIRRKYSLSQVEKIFREWLKPDEIHEGTFVHFVGKGERGGQAEEEGFLGFLRFEAPGLLRFVEEEGPILFKKALLLCLWSEGFDLPASRLISLVSFLRKGGKERGELMVKELSSAARLLAQREPDLFEKIVSEVEEAGGVLSEVSGLLGDLRPIDLFRREAIFPSLLRESFERLLAMPEEMSKEVEFSPIEGPNIVPRTSGFLAKRAEMVEILRKDEAFRQKLLALKRREGSLPQDFEKWEQFYIRHLSPFGFLLATLPSGLTRMEVGLPPPVRERFERGMALQSRFEELFSRFYHEALPLWEAGKAERPRMIEDLERIKGTGDLQKTYLLMDGMRWDLWEYLKEHLFAALSHQLRIVREGALWAHFPSTTPRQLEFLEDETRLLKITGIDERVHTEKGDLEYLFRNVLQFLQLELASRLREVPSGSPIILFSDHGFVENPRFEKTDKYRLSRYVHGEASPFEIIVPWAEIVKVR